MKIGESILTYVPFIYLYMVSSIYGSLYHNSDYVKWQPFVVIIFGIVNTMVFLNFRSKRFIKNIIHLHVWNTVTMGVFGILLNNVNTEMLRDFHLSDGNLNFWLSVFYFGGITIMCNYFEAHEYAIVVNMVFLLVPFKRNWQINLYLYVAFITIDIFIMFRRCRKSTLVDRKVHMLPLVKFFMYLRLDDSVVLVGFIHLYIEYYQSTIPEIKAINELNEIIDEYRQAVKNYDPESDETTL
jgi:hypothetical protein